MYIFFFFVLQFLASLSSNNQSLRSETIAMLPFLRNESNKSKQMSRLPLWQVFFCHLERKPFICYIPSLLIYLYITHPTLLVLVPLVIVKLLCARIHSDLMFPFLFELLHTISFRMIAFFLSVLYTSVKPAVGAVEGRGLCVVRTLTFGNNDLFKGD